jgi:hypothetical protein
MALQSSRLALRRFFQNIARKVRSNNDRMMRNSYRFQRSFAAEELSRLSGEADRFGAKYGEDAKSTLGAREDQDASSSRLEDLSHRAPC